MVPEDWREVDHIHWHVGHQSWFFYTSYSWRTAYSAHHDTLLQAFAIRIMGVNILDVGLLCDGRCFYPLRRRVLTSVPEVGAHRAIHCRQ